MKREMKFIALFDDGSQVSNSLKLHFQKGSGYSVTRVYSLEELEYKMKKESFDIIICPAKNPVRACSSARGGKSICLFWSVVKTPKKAERLHRHPSFLFEIEADDTLLSYHTSGDEPIGDQFNALSRLLASLDHYHQDFARFLTDADMLNSIVEESVTGIIYLLQNKIQWMNHEAIRILERTEHELKEKEFSSLFPDKSRYQEFIRNISKNRNMDGWGIARCTFVRKNGEGVDCRIRMRRLNPMNPQKGYVVFLEDNEEQTHLESALGEYRERIARNEEKYLDLMHQMNHVIVRTDLNGTITFWNPPAEAAFGFSASEAKGSSLIDLVADPGSRTANDMSILMFDSGATRVHATLHVFDNRTKSGSHLWVAWNILLFPDAEGSLAGILWIGQNISDVDQKGDQKSLPEPWIHQLLKGTDIGEEVFGMLFHAAIELGRGGRELRKVGMSVVIGDAEKVMAESRQLGINAFSGKSPGHRMVQSGGNIENIKNLALLDGAFVIDGSGFIHASSRQLLADATNIEIFEGLGTRHVSVAAMTLATRSVGIVVSESGGTVTIFKAGKIVRQFAP